MRSSCSKIAVSLSLLCEAKSLSLSVYQRPRLSDGLSLAADAGLQPPPNTDLSNLILTLLIYLDPLHLPLSPLCHKQMNLLHQYLALGLLRSKHA